MDNFMDQTEMSIDIASSNSAKEDAPQTLIPVTLSLPTTEATTTTTKSVLQQAQAKKIISAPTTSQVFVLNAHFFLHFLNLNRAK